MEFTKLEKYFDVESLIDQTEKNTLTALSYVQPVPVRDTLTSLSKANADFARANFTALKSVQDFVKSSFDGVTKQAVKANK